MGRHSGSTTSDYPKLSAKKPHSKTLMLTFHCGQLCIHPLFLFANDLFQMRLIEQGSNIVRISKPLSLLLDLNQQRIHARNNHFE